MGGKEGVPELDRGRLRGGSTRVSLAMARDGPLKALLAAAVALMTAHLLLSILRTSGCRYMAAVVITDPGPGEGRHEGIARRRPGGVATAPLRGPDGALAPGLNMFKERLSSARERGEMNEKGEARGPEKDLVEAAMEPTPVTEHKGVITVVMSARENFEARRAIRETWAWNRTGKDVFFMVGRQWCEFPPRAQAFTAPCERWMASNITDSELAEYNANQATVQAALQQELADFGDLVMLQLKDTYGNLARKTLLSASWIAINYPGYWMFKVDDDVVANPDAAWKRVQQYNGSSVMRVVGALSKHIKVMKTGKWQEHRYKGAKYPWYPQGAAGYLLSPELIAKFDEHQDKLYMYRCEDAAVGLWVRDLRLRVRKHQESRLYFVDGCSVECCLNDDITLNAKLSYAHRYTPDEIRACAQHATLVPPELRPPTKPPTPSLALDSPEASGPEPELLTIVMSQLKHGKQREVAMETWLPEEQPHVYFFVGGKLCEYALAARSSTDPCAIAPGLDPKTDDVFLSQSDLDAQKKALASARAEAATNPRLIVLEDVYDSPNGVSTLFMEALKWVDARYKPRWLAKVNDKSVVLLDRLRAYVRGVPDMPPRVLGKLNKAIEPQKTGVFAELKFDEAVYPTYAQGAAGFAMHGSILRNIVAHADELERYRFEDTSLSIWISRLEWAEPVLFASSYFDEGCGVYCCINHESFLFVYGSSFSPRHVRRCSKALDLLPLDADAGQDPGADAKGDANAAGK